MTDLVKFILYTMLGILFLIYLFFIFWVVGKLVMLTVKDILDKDKKP